MTLADLPRRHESDVAWESLKFHPDNPRRGDVALIEESLRQNGWYGTVVAQESTGFILIGNHRSRAAQNIGLETCPDVQWVTCDDEQAKRILLSDNRAADMAYYDDASLAKLLDELAETDEGFVGTGFDGGSYELVLQNLAAQDEGGTRGDVGDVPTPAERAEEWESNDIRSVILPYAGEDYDRVLDALVALRSRWGLDTNAQVVLQMALDATKG
jgi:hypothetical protein